MGIELYSSKRRFDDIMDRIESFTFRFIQFSLIFGVLLYDFIGWTFGFTYIDEFLLLVLLIYSFSNTSYSKEFKVFWGIFAFYLVYSLLFGVACNKAIFTDAIICLKPFVGFYAAIQLGMQMDDIQKQNVKRLVVVISVGMLTFSIIAYNYVMFLFMGHPSRFATLFQILGIIYFYCSDRSKKELLKTIILFGCSILSLRSKSFAFVGASVFLFYFMDAKKLERIRLSTIISVLICIGIVFLVAWEKFQFYFITGSSDDMTESFARPALYQGAFVILKDYFPFGPGLGSYANFASAEYYSPLYYKYGLNNVFGLAEGEGSFIADTFFPQLAQFGIVGVILFFMFFRKRYKETMYYYSINCDPLIMKMSLLILIFFMIESSVDSTFVHNRGMIMMILWGMIINESKYKDLIE